jgi:hypothetical protein
MRTSYQRRLVEEYKRNILILDNILMIVDIKHVKYHMHKLNKYTPHIKFGLFSNLSVIRCYNLNNIQLQVLYNNLLYNGYIK